MTNLFLQFNHSYKLNVSHSILGRVSSTTNYESVHLQRLRAVLPYVLIMVSFLTTLSNSLVLATFLKYSNLRTPFNCYLISLTIADVGQAALDLPFTIFSHFDPVWSLGRIVCNFELYAKWVFSGVVRNTHALISLNRLWALFWPIYYKRYHTKTVAFWLCMGSWAYVHIFLLPGLVADDLYYRVDDGTCYVNTTAQRSWALPTQFVLYNSTLVVIMVMAEAVVQICEYVRTSVFDNLGSNKVDKKYYYFYQ